MVSRFVARRTSSPHASAPPPLSGTRSSSAARPSWPTRPSASRQAHTRTRAHAHAQARAVLLPDPDERPSA
eukprot:2903581-Pleurochrysis_carterae.AAC.1